LQASLRRLALASTLIPIIGICPLINHIQRSWKHVHKYKSQPDLVRVGLQHGLTRLLLGK
jgi:hypothetical protein